MGKDLKWIIVFAMGILASVTQTVFCADIIVNSSAKINLPLAGTAGRLYRVTDDIRGLWMDQGSQWFGLSGEVINVKEFGAKGDGTTNDTTSIQAALNAVPASGGMVFFPPGNYLVTASLKPKVNTTLTGAGYGSRITATSAGWDNGCCADQRGIISIYNLGEANIRITNLRIYGTTTAATTDLTPKLIYFDLSNKITIDHNWLENAGCEGIWQGNQSFTNKIIIDSNHLNTIGMNCGSFSALPAIQINAEEGVISNNRIYNVGSGIAGNGRKLTITGNVVKDITGWGITTGEGVSSGIITVTGNIVEFTASSTVNRAGYFTEFASSGNNNSISSYVGNYCHLIGNSAFLNNACYEIVSNSNVSLVGNVAEIDTRGRGFYLRTNLANSTMDVHLTGNLVKVTGESGTSWGFYGVSQGSTYVLNVRSTGNRVIGLTRAGGNYAYYYGTSPGEALNATSWGDYATDGYAQWGNHNYDATLNTTIDDQPIFENNDLAKNTGIFRAPRIGMFNLQDSINITVATDSINISGVNVNSKANRRTLIKVDTEGAAATDNLSTISGGNAGDMLILGAVNDARTIVLKDGVGNLRLAGDCSLDNVDDRIVLLYDGTNWYELARSNNGV